MKEEISVINKTKTPVPKLPFSNMKEAVLGQKYELSFVFIGEKKSQELNKQYRGKDKSTDVLSFPLSKTSGEIFICPHVAKRKTKDFDRNFQNFVGFLFIHGLFHLKGMKHGSTMERAEKKIRVKFAV